MGVYIWTDKWLPWDNTLLYYPFKEDQLDKVWSSSIGTAGSKQTIGYTFSGSSVAITNPPTWCRFISVWTKYNSLTGWANAAWPSCYIWDVKYNFAHSNNNYLRRFQIRTWSDSWASSSTQLNTTTWVRYYFAMGYDWSKVWGFFNWNKIWEETKSQYTPWTMQILSSNGSCSMTVSEFIGENRVWTAEEVANYYNQTKANYTSNWWWAWGSDIK